MQPMGSLGLGSRQVLCNLQQQVAGCRALAWGTMAQG